MSKHPAAIVQTTFYSIDGAVPYFFRKLHRVGVMLRMTEGDDGWLFTADRKFNESVIRLADFTEGDFWPSPLPVKNYPVCENSIMMFADRAARNCCPDQFEAYVQARGA